MPSPASPSTTSTGGRSAPGSRNAETAASSPPRPTTAMDRHTPFRPLEARRSCEEGLGGGLRELAELAADEQDPLADRDPGERREHVERPLQPPPRRYEQRDCDQHDPLAAGSESDV